MSTLRGCQECYDRKLKDYPAQLQPREAPSRSGPKGNR